MQPDFASAETIQKLDPKQVLASTEMLAKQCEQVWSDTASLEFPQEYKQITNVVVCGMGGSAYGGHVVGALFKEELKVPFSVNSDYTLPGSVDANTLVVLTSYSGSTEETLHNGELAKARGAKIIGLTSGGKLAEFCKANNYPAYVFNPTYNPSTQPRLGTGYIITGTIVLFHKLGLITLNPTDMQTAISELAAAKESIRNTALEFVPQLVNQQVEVFGAEFLAGNAHIMQNQFHETAKVSASFHNLPELNHHRMEGLTNPKDKKLTVIYLQSSLYSPVIQKRGTLTGDVIQKNAQYGNTFLPYTVCGTTKIAQVLNVLAFGGFLTVYLAFTYGLDPSLIPWVDYFKEQLKK